jgi:hypothetical protein
MAVTPVPDLTFPQNQGFEENDTSPIIHSVRWRHLPSRYIFADVHDVVTYHQKGPLVIDINAHTVSYLDVYFLKDVGITEAKAYLRFVRKSDGTLIEEPYLFGEGGRSITIEPDVVNQNLMVMKGIAFTQRDLGDGTPMYDFISMAGEGVYEVWIKAVTDTNKELHLRVPFQWANLVPDSGGTGGSGNEGSGSGGGVEGELHAQYDEYYVTIVEGDSPFTKRPSTHFRLAAIGMLMKPYCFVRKDTPKQPPIEKPADSPVIGDKPTPPCALTINPTTVNKSTGETATFTLNHANTSGVLKIETKFDNTALEDLGNGSFKVLKNGTFPVDFTVIYNDGQECKVTGTIVGEFSCEFDVTASVTTTEVGQTITFTYNHGKNSGLLKGVSMELPPEVTKVGDNKVTSNTAGAFQIKFIADYGDGNLCEKTLIVEFTHPTPPPSGGGDNGSGGNVILCGQTANSSSGFGEFTHPVTEEGIYYIEYDFFGAVDRMFVYVGGNLIYDTGERKYKDGSPFGFHYKPSDGELKVRMNNAGSGTKWAYTLYCPSSVPQEVKDKATIVN